jgi:hypothetical protein
MQFLLGLFGIPKQDMSLIYLCTLPAFAALCIWLGRSSPS